MKIQLFYFDECPYYERALANVREALRAEGLPEVVEAVRVMSDEDAHATRFLGSPTIRINGIDLEGAAADTRGYGYGCRVYESEGQRIGWPSVVQVRESLRSAASR